MSSQNYSESVPVMTKEDFVYSRIGMALVSAQRVEYLTGQLLECLIQFDNLYSTITTAEFLGKSTKSKKAFKTLGNIFMLLKLNPKLIIENDLDEYLNKRNHFVHEFWFTYMSGISTKDIKEAVDFCYDFGRHSDRISSFFQGFLYFMALRHVKNRNELDQCFRLWDDDFEYFLSTLQQERLNNA